MDAFSTTTLLWGVMLLAAMTVVWTAYGLSFGPVEGADLPLPAPEYWNGLIQRSQSLNLGRQYYLNGSISSDGWWYYYLLVLLYKTPIATTSLAVAYGALVLAGRLSFPPGLRAAIVTCAAYLAVISAGGIDLGVRHVLFAYPLLYVTFGSLWRLPVWRWAAVTAATIVSGSALATYPDYVSFFNELVAGPTKQRLLADSNLDWGQGLRALAKYQRENDVDVIALGYFGTARPEGYGVRACRLASFGSERFTRSVDCALEPVIAVSLTLLQGLYVGREAYEWLRRRAPTAIVGGSIAVFDLRAERDVRKGDDRNRRRLSHPAAAKPSSSSDLLYEGF